MSNNLIHIQDLSKTYGNFLALDKLTLSVQPGEIFGYLGPNGAGKTTTIRILLDIIRPSSGSASIFGLDARQHSVEIHRRVGFLPGELALWEGQRSIDIVKYFARIHGGVQMPYVHELAERFQFDLSKKVREYSTGNKRKLGLILAMMHKPELLILDEPTSGLDPLMQQTFNQMMREIRDEGRTVFLSSHMLSEVQAICERVAVLRQGQLKAIERVDRLTRVEFRWVTLTLNDVTGIANQLGAVAGVSEVDLQSRESVRFKLNGDFDPLLRALADRYVVNIHIEEPTLEEIFLSFYNEDGQMHNQNQNTRLKEG